MAAETTAMLFALTSPHPSLSLADFNKWYDERHAPSRAACPGVHSVCRFHLVDEAKSSKRVGDWDWVAVYELESEKALKTSEYQNARKEDGDDESKMFDFLSRRVYRLLKDNRQEDYSARASSGKSRLVSMTGVQPDTASDKANDELIEQYQRLKVAKYPNKDGWLRTSVWKLTTAADPRTWERQTNVPSLLVLHEWEDTSAMLNSDALEDSLADHDEEMASNKSQLLESALLRLWKQF